MADDELDALSHYPAGIPNPRKLGFITGGMIGQPFIPDAADIDEVARRLGRAARYTDADGFEHEIFAAAVHPDAASATFAYVESRCKTVDWFVDIDFTIVLSRAGAVAYSAPVYCYNPYFGCNVRHIGWHGDHLVIIYREKHRTYAFRLHRDYPRPGLDDIDDIDDEALDHGDDVDEREDDLEPRPEPWRDDGDFYKISDDWALLRDHLVYAPYDLSTVSTLPLREVAPPRSLTPAQARAEGWLPEGYDELRAARA